MDGPKELTKNTDQNRIYSIGGILLATPKNLQTEKAMFL